MPSMVGADFAFELIWPLVFTFFVLVLETFPFELEQSSMTACLLFACTWLWFGVGYPMVLLVASNRAGGGGGLLDSLNRAGVEGCATLQIALAVEGCVASNCVASNCAEGGGLRNSSKL